jgi:hypothetical protein
MDALRNGLSEIERVLNPLKFYDMYLAEISQCDQKMAALLTKYTPKESEAIQLSDRVGLKKDKKQKAKFSPGFNVRELAFVHLRTDLFQIPGVSHTTVLSILCNLGNASHPDTGVRAN